jgi:heme/copper-type cytochrome/quinol oxidase subunit 3
MLLDVRECPVAKSQTTELHLFQVLASVAIATSAFTMEQALVQLIPSRAPYFIVLVVLLTVLYGLLFVGIRLFTDLQLWRSVMNGMARKGLDQGQLSRREHYENMED